jgi:hypothetical protein
LLDYEPLPTGRTYHRARLTSPTGSPASPQDLARRPGGNIRDIP